MFLKKLLFLFFLASYSLFASASESYSSGPIPSWVKQSTLFSEINSSQSEGGLQCLYIDTQLHKEEETRYISYAHKALTKASVEAISQISIDFDPSYQKVVIHKIQVLRDGICLDKIETSEKKVMQREQNAHSNLYDGSLSLVYFLNDIRVSDIVECAYSIIGENPLFSSHLWDSFSLQGFYPIGKISYRVIGDKNRSLLIKTESTQIEPTITDFSSDLKEWSWECKQTAKARRYDPGEPYWYETVPRVEISEYESWQEVALQLLPLYVLPENLNEVISSEMLELIQSFKENTTDPRELAKLALEFVQDEIRYLAFLEGINGHKPSSPADVFTRRFGDCKAKTFLLHTLLSLMNISSTPLLVHTTQGKILPERLPSPFAFNHITLQINIDGATYFVDPTISLQGGSLETTFFPDYEFGLLLSKETQELTKLPTLIQARPTEIYTSFSQGNEEEALIQMTTVLYDSRAEYKRYCLAVEGLSRISEDELLEMESIYGKVSIFTPLEIFDDREKNVVILTSAYLIPTKIKEGQQTVEIFSNILKYCLDSSFSKERTSPYCLRYPLWIKEQIHVENLRLECIPSLESFTQEHESIFFSYSCTQENRSIDAYLELHHLKGYVEKEALTTYLATVKEIEKKIFKDQDLAKLLYPDKKRFTESESRQIALSFLDNLPFENPDFLFSSLAYQNLLTEEKGKLLWKEAYSHAFGKRFSEEDLLTEEEVLTVLIEHLAFHLYKDKAPLEEALYALFTLKYNKVFNVSD